MATIPQTKYEVFEPGTYRAKLGAVALEDGDFGTQAALRFDLVEPGFEGKSLRAWASAKLTGGKRPSKLYSWTSALLFNGRALPEGFDLDTDMLLDKEALLVVEVVEKDGLEKNRVAQLLPLRAAARPAAPATRAAGSASPATRPVGVTVAAAAAALTAAARPQPVRVNQGIAGPVDIPEWLGGAEDGDGDVPF
jgi:hypothetical protein